MVPSERAPIEEWLEPKLPGAYLVIVVGGDGAVRMTAPAIIRSGVLMYHYPCGTENLFAREFGMEANAGAVVSAIESGTPTPVDVGVANGEIFLLMISIGFDAEVVHDLASRRTGSISHLSYVGPMLRQFRRWIPPQLRVSVDDRRIDDGVGGFLVIANSRQYAMRMNPAWKARMDDGVLDAVYFPTRSISDLLAWMLRCEFGSQGGDPRLNYQTGERIAIESDEPFRYQVDGDPPLNLDPVSRVEIDVRPKTMRVLVPLE